MPGRELSAYYAGGGMKSTLESLQHYNDGGRYTNPKNHPAECRQDDEFVCPYCLKIVMDDDYEMCNECRMAMAEYREER